MMPKDREPVNAHIAELWKKVGLGFNDHSIVPATIEAFAQAIINDVLNIMDQPGNEKSIIAKWDIKDRYGMLLNQKETQIMLNKERNQ